MTLPELSATKLLTFNFHVDDSAKGRYDLILGRDILTALGLNLKFPDHAIEAYDGPFKGYMASVVDMGTYEFKYLNIQIQVRLHLENSLQFFTHNKYMNCNEFILLLSNYV